MKTIKMTRDFLDFATAIAHARSHASVPTENAINYINTVTGDRRGCIGNLLSNARANFYPAWFDNQDLVKTKNWAFTAALLDQMYSEFDPNYWWQTYHHFFSLISDFSPIIEKFSKIENVHLSAPNQYLNPKYWAYNSHQTLLALRGDWEALRDRSERVLASPTSKQSRHLEDHKFFVALANADISAMEAALITMVTDKNIQRRYLEIAAPFAWRLVDTNAVIYAKIAWRHGFQVRVDSPLVPAEWLPIAPLAEYKAPYAFMDAWVI
jgi:Immunity protein 49